MSSYVYGYDDEEGDRYIEVQIYYETEEPVYEKATWSCPEYYLPGQIYVTSVEVLFVEYYDKDGNIIDKIKRPNPPTAGWQQLDREEEARICDWVDNQDCICEDLWENRG